MKRHSLPEPPPDFVARARHKTLEVGVSTRDLPGGFAYKPSEWISAGRYGATMHEDRHASARYVVLLVCHGEPPWELVHCVGPAVRYSAAHKGSVLLFNAHKPHALTPMNRADVDFKPSESGWVALAWQRDAKRLADAVRKYLCGLYGVDA